MSDQPVNENESQPVEQGQPVTINPAENTQQDVQPGDYSPTDPAAQPVAGGNPGLSDQPEYQQNPQQFGGMPGGEQGAQGAVAQDVQPVRTSASNESPSLPPTAAAGAARAHALLGHFVLAAQKIQSDLARFVPQSALDAAEVEVKAMLREIL
jgi:hypothetical protein